MAVCRRRVARAVGRSVAREELGWEMLEEMLRCISEVLGPAPSCAGEGEGEGAAGGGGAFPAGIVGAVIFEVTVPAVVGGTDGTCGGKSRG